MVLRHHTQKSSIHQDWWRPVQFNTGYKQLWHLCQVETTQWSFKLESDNFSKLCCCVAVANTSGNSLMYTHRLIFVSFGHDFLSWQHGYCPMKEKNLWIRSGTINPVLYAMLRQSKTPRWFIIRWVLLLTYPVEWMLILNHWSPNWKKKKS